jgi:hypothetical protein
MMASARRTHARPHGNNLDDAGEKCELSWRRAERGGIVRCHKQEPISGAVLRSSAVCLPEIRQLEPGRAAKKGVAMGMFLTAWSRMVMTLAFDLWRYPDAIRREREAEPKVR